MAVCGGLLGLHLSGAPETATGDRGSAIMVGSVLSEAELMEQRPIYFALQLRDYDDLRHRVDKGEVLSVKELRDRYLPTAQAWRTVANWAATNGYSVGSDDGIRMTVFAKASARLIQNSLKAQLAKVVEAEGREVVAPVSKTEIPSELQGIVREIVYPKTTPRIPVARADSISLPQTSQGGSSLSPQAIRQLYRANQLALDGEGQTIVVVGTSQVSVADLTAYWSLFGLPTTLAQYSVAELPLENRQPLQDLWEPTFCIEMASGMAPKAKILYVPAQSPAAFAPLVLSKLAEDPGIRQLTGVGGLSEISSVQIGHRPDDTPYYLALSAAGITCFVGTGNSGSNSLFVNGVLQGTQNYNPDGALAPDYPGSDPYVTSVGGTAVGFTRGTDGLFNWPATEGAWCLPDPAVSTEAGKKPNYGEMASTGGISLIFQRPEWQSGPNLPQGNMRCVPDVAAFAKGNVLPLLVYKSNHVTSYGIAFSEAIWVGLCALLNQAREKEEYPPLGLLGPRVYPLMGTSAFRSTTVGSSDGNVFTSTATNGAYGLGEGYNLVTGLGTPDMERLVAALTPPQPQIVAQPLSQSIHSGETVSFKVRATGKGKSYQWYFEGNAIAGAVSDTYTIEKAHLGSAGSYSVVVSNPYGTICSASALLAFVPTNLDQARQVIAFGQPVTLRVEAAGKGFLRYQWYHDNRSIPGANDASYGIGCVSSADNGAYWVEASDDLGTVKSEPYFIVAAPKRTLASSWGYFANAGAAVVPDNLSDVVAISAGYVHAVALRADGTVVAWGVNDNGQTQVPKDLGDVVAISAGTDFTLALKADGTVVAWGSNVGGKSTIPSGLKNVIAVSAGGNFALALKSDGTVVAWGDNTLRQTFIPSDLKNVIQVLASSDHAMALQSDGKVVSWGYNSNGQTTVPADLENLRSVASGTFFSLVLKWDGSVAGWGYTSGQLLAIPSTLKNAVALAAGGSMSIALKADNTLAYWGSTLEGKGLYTDVTAVDAGSVYGLVLRDAAAPAKPAFTAAPANCAVGAGMGARFAVQVSGAPFPNLRWQESADGGRTWSDLNDTVSCHGAASCGLAIAVTNPSMDDRRYRCVATNNQGSAISSPARLNINATPLIVLQPMAQAVELGQSTSLSVKSRGEASIRYQWYKDASPIAGATGATYNIASTTQSEIGVYTVRVTDSTNSVLSTPAQLVIGHPSRLTALSVRTESGPGVDVLTVGIAVTATSAGEKKQVIVRGVGPGLLKEGITNFLTDPEARVYSGNTAIASNDNWDAATMKVPLATVGLDTLAVGSRDAAMIAQFADGGYSVQVGARMDERGVALAEIYESDSATKSHMYAMSVRAKAGMAEKTLIAGLGITGPVNKRLVIRGLGPALAGALGSGYLVDPKLEVYSGGTMISSNDNWGNTAELQAAFALAGLLPMEATSKDAALVVDLPPGGYSVWLTGVNNTTGVGLIEIYELQ